ncbi:MAG TPA: DUF4404 family protein, partial [Pirellulales bacterium]|nr:DUF4404 family protein [Pirellulales bacterium]
MAEHSERLQTTLVELHDQLANTREITPELRKSLAGLATDIERILAEQAAGQSPASIEAGARVRQHES